MDVKIASVLNTYNVYNNNNPSGKKINQSDRNEAKDTFSLSAQAGDYQTVRKALAQAPDIREDKVAALSAKVSSGTYSVNANDIAAKMFQRWNA